MSRKTIFYLTIFLVFASACKKGEEDPFLSLATRKARLCGEWTMNDYSFESKDIHPGYTNWSTTNMIEDKLNFLSVFVDDTVRNEKTIISYTITIDKDGTWKRISEANCVRVENFTGAPGIGTYSYHELITESGTWAFVDATKNEYKNKERISLSTTEHKYENRGGTNVYTWHDPTNDPMIFTSDGYITIETYANGENTVVYDISMLKSKEMKWVRDNNYSYTEGMPDLEAPSTETSSETIVWVAK